MTKKELETPPQQIHNNVVEDILSEPNTLKEFLQTHIPPQLLEGLDLDSVTTEPRHFIEPNLRKYIADLLVKAKCHRDDVYYYFVIEAKSSPKKLTAAQAFHYAIKVMMHYADLKKQKPLPLVYPLVLYHGRKKFSYPMNIRDLIDASEEAISLLFDRPVQLIDLSQVSDEQLLHDTQFPLSFIELVLKHIYDADLLKTIHNIEEFIPLFKKYATEFGVQKAIKLLQYWYSAGNISNKDQFAEAVSAVDPVFGEAVMTLQQVTYEQGIEAGIQKGLQRGLQEGMQKGISMQQTLIASKMLSMGESVEKISTILGLSAKDLAQLVKKQAESVEN